MKEIHRYWPLIGRCIRRQRNRNCPRPDLAGKMGRDALKFTGHRNEATRLRGYEAKRPHMAPYLQNASGCHNRSLGISVFHVNSWVKPQNQLAMTSQGADQPLCQVEEQHSQEASRGASEAGQKDLPWATVWKMFEMECRNSAVNSWFLAYSNMFKCSHQDPLTIRELQWVTFCTLDWRFERHQHAPAQQIPVKVDAIETCETPGHVTHVNAILPGLARAQVQIRFPSWDHALKLEPSWTIVTICYNLFYVLLWNLMGVLWPMPIIANMGRDM